jgi:predicted enzyme related to lactoylglutathione lyase
MLENHSVPSNTVLPHVVYQDVAQAIAWLTRVFEFREYYRYDDPVSGAQMYLGGALIMLKRARAGSAAPAQIGARTQVLTVFVDDVDKHFERAKSEGAKIFEELHETGYGERQYVAEDFDGHHWLFSQHARDVSPDEWGAVIASPTSRLELLPRPRWCYLEIPAIAINESVAFYEKVFGWNIRHRDTERPSFDDATGNVSGAWVIDRAAARDPGLLPYIWVDSVEATLVRIAAYGGEVVAAPSTDPQDANRIATFRDPAGNLIGLYEERRV